MRPDGRCARAAFAVLALAAGFSGPARGEDAEEPAPPAPAVRPHAPLALAPAPIPSAEAVRRVEALVAALAGTASRHGGLDETIGGGPFFERTDREAWTRAPSDTEPAAAWRALVALGPVAMPALLAHLDDATPTKVKIEHGGGFGAMWLAPEVPANPALADECAAVLEALGTKEGEAREESAFDEGPIIDEHTVTVGDACFALLGQITNRAYQAMRYQPTGCFVVTSPTRDPRVARAVRAQWEGKDLRAALAARLLADFHTTGVWGLAANALERLVAYFPEAAEGMLLREVERLGAVEAPDAPADAIEPAQVASIAASVAAERPAVREALARSALRVSDAEVLATVLEGVPDLRDEALLKAVPGLRDEAVVDRMLEVALSNLQGSGIAARRLLAEIERRAPDRYPSALRRALRRGMEGIRAVLALHDERPAPLAVADWRPLLPVTDPATLWRGHPPLPLERLRVCDAAAVHIARLRPDLPFDAEKPEAERDARIAEIRRTLDAEAKGEVR